MLPETVGFLIPPSTTVPDAPPASVLPPVRVIVTTWPATDTVAVPSSVPPTLPKVAPLTSNPAGKVTSILPSFSTAFVVVNETVALPVAPATNEAGSTFVPVSAPGAPPLPSVIVTGLTGVPSWFV